MKRSKCSSTDRRERRCCHQLKTMTPVRKVPDRVQDTMAELNEDQLRVDHSIGVTTSQFATRSQRLCLIPRAEKATSPKIGSAMNSLMKLTRAGNAEAE